MGDDTPHNGLLFPSDRPGWVVSRWKNGEPLKRNSGSLGFRDSVPCDLYRAVIVAVVTMWMMQVTADKIVRVIPVRNGLMTAIGAMLMACVMVATCMIGRTGVGILARDAHGMFVMMPFMLVVHVTVVQIVGVPLVLNRGMAAIGAMGMIAVIAVNFVIVAHGLFLLPFGLTIRERVHAYIFHSCLHLGVERLPRFPPIDEYESQPRGALATMKEVAPVQSVGACMGKQVVNMVVFGASFI